MRRKIAYPPGGGMTELRGTDDPLGCICFASDGNGISLIEISYT